MVYCVLVGMMETLLECLIIMHVFLLTYPGHFEELTLFKSVI